MKTKLERQREAVNERYADVRRLTRERVRRWRKKQLTALQSNVEAVAVLGLDTPEGLKVPKGSKHRPGRKLGAVIVW